MTRHGVESTPENFEVWFKFALGRTPELTRTIEILISNKRSFDAATNRSLFSTFAAPLPDRADQEVTDRLGRILAEARRFVQRSLEANREHMNALGSVAAQIGDGEDAAQIIKALLDELAKATTRAAAMESHFSASLRELEKVRNTLAAAEQRSNTDPLTGLANRHALGEFCRRAQMLAMESGQPLSLLMIDIDHFKQFNDRFGHQFGDQVIRLVASVLKEGLRGDDLAARYGGEELVGVLPGANLARCEEAAERIRQTIAKRQVTRRATGEALARVTVSVGVAQFVPGETLAELIERCDRALYAAKRGGRNRTVTERDADGPVAAGSLPRYGARGRPFHSGTPNSCRG
jgi:diguanylate cyclase